MGMAHNWHCCAPGCVPLRLAGYVANAACVTISVEGLTLKWDDFHFRVSCYEGVWHANWYAGCAAVRWNPCRIKAKVSRPVSDSTPPPPSSFKSCLLHVMDASPSGRQTLSFVPGFGPRMQAGLRLSSACFPCLKIPRAGSIFVPGVGGPLASHPIPGYTWFAGAAGTCERHAWANRLIGHFIDFAPREQVLVNWAGIPGVGQGSGGGGTWILPIQASTGRLGAEGDGHKTTWDEHGSNSHLPCILAQWLCEARCETKRFNLWIV